MNIINEDWIVFKILRHFLFKIEKAVDKSRIIDYNVNVNRNTTNYATKLRSAFVINIL